MSVDRQLKAALAAITSRPDLGVQATLSLTTGRVHDELTGEVSAGSTTTLSVRVTPPKEKGQFPAPDGTVIRSKPSAVVAAESLNGQALSIGNGDRVHITIGSNRYRVTSLREMLVGREVIGYRLFLDQL